MGSHARVKVADEIRTEPRSNNWALAFENVTYVYTDRADPQKGFRFIWCRLDGSLQAARGQASAKSKPHLRKWVAKELPLAIATKTTANVPMVMSQASARASRSGLLMS